MVCVCASQHGSFIKEHAAEALAGLLSSVKDVAELAARRERNPMTSWVDNSLLEVDDCLPVPAKPPRACHSPTCLATHAQEERPTTSLVSTLWRAVEQLQTSEHEWAVAITSARPYQALADDLEGITARPFEAAQLPIHVR